VAFALGVASNTSENSSIVTCHLLQDEAVGTGDDAHRPVVGQQNTLEIEQIIIFSHEHIFNRLKLLFGG
jgi:hypothetical protein